MSYSALATLLRSTAAKLASLPQSVAAFLAADETPLESVPEPYVPLTTETTVDASAASAAAAATTAAAAAAATSSAAEEEEKKGDLGPHHHQPPESPPATATTGPMGASPTLRERATGGANPSLLGDPVSLKAEQSALVPTPDEAGAPPSSSSASAARTHSHKELRREKEVKASHGPDANPSMLGDPISMTSEVGMARRASKL